MTTQALLQRWPGGQGSPFCSLVLCQNHGSDCAGGHQLQGAPGRGISIPFWLLQHECGDARGCVTLLGKGCSSCLAPFCFPTLTAGLR